MDMLLEAAPVHGSSAAVAVGSAWPSSPKPVAAKRISSDPYVDDESLIQACLDHDQSAWEKLVQRYASLVYSIPRRIGLSAAEADDVFQNVFVITYRRLNSLKNRQRLAAWLVTVARRECFHYMRRMPEHDSLLDEVADGGLHLSSQIERQQRCLIVHEALSQLDPNSQALLSALFLETPTPSYEAIAKRLGMALGSIGPARARCLIKLENVLLAMGGDKVSAMMCSDD